MGSESDSVELAVELFSMLADATRVRVILALRGRELSVNNLADIVEKSPAAVSQHLAKLRLARIVQPRQEGTKIFYRLANEHAKRLVTDAMFQAEHSLQLADWPGRDERLADQPVCSQLGQPLLIRDIGFASREVLGMSGVDQHHVQMLF